MSKTIDRLTAVGNALGLEGRFGAKYGLVQLRARLDACVAAVFEDPEADAELDWRALARPARPDAGGEGGGG